MPGALSRDTFRISQQPCPAPVATRSAKHHPWSANARASTNRPACRALKAARLPRRESESRSVPHKSTNPAAGPSAIATATAWLSATTGLLLWSYTTGGQVQSSPAVANGAVYVGSEDKNVYALNATTGAKLWSYATGDFVHSSPAVANGVVYVGSWDHNVYALHAKTGAKLWSYATGDQIDFSSSAVVDGMVYVGSKDGAVYVFGLP